MEVSGGDWEEWVCGILGFPGTGNLFSVLFWGSCVIQNRETWWADFFFFFNYLLVGFLRIWQWASQSDLPSSHDVLVQPQFALQNMTRGALTRMRPKMLLPLLKSHPQIPWEKSLMFPWLDTVLEEQAMAGRRQAWAALKPC